VPTPRVALVALVAAVTSGGCAFISRVDVDTPAPSYPQFQAIDFSISNDGRFVAFEREQGPEERSRIYVRDQQTSSTELVSIAPLGATEFEAIQPAISGNGRWVAYAAFPFGDDDTRVDVFLFDRTTDTTVRVTDQAGGVDADSTDPVLSVDGAKVGFLSYDDDLVAGDGNGFADAFVWTRSSDTTARVSIGENGVALPSQSYDLSMNDSGRFVAWRDAFSQIYVRDLVLGTTDHLNPDFGPGGPFSTFRPSVSEDGRFVAFDGEIAAPDHRTFRFDRTNDVLVTASLTSGGAPAGTSHVGQISGDGTMIVFTSDVAATAADVNPGIDVYVRDLAAGRTKLLSSDLLLGAWTGDVRDEDSSPVVLSRDGSYAAFSAEGTGLVDGHGNSLVVRATRHVTVTAAVPSALPDGTTTVVELAGTGFRPDTQIGLSGDARERWNVTLVHYLDEHTMHITVEIVPGAAPGPVNVVAINPGSGWGPYYGAANWCLGCVSIT
jgi:Tol biopolymer transport system component